MIGRRKHRTAAPVATHEVGPRSRHIVTDEANHRAQISLRRVRVAHMEADNGAHSDVITHRDRAGRRVSTHDPTDDVVRGRYAIHTSVAGYTDMQATDRESLISRVE